MPEFKERLSYEERIAKAMRDVFDEALKVADLGIGAINKAIRQALNKYVGPIVEEIHRRVLVLMLIFFGDDDGARTVFGDAIDQQGPLYRDLDLRARQRASEQVRILGRQMSDTNRAWWDEMPDDSTPEDWASERLLTDSRIENVSITETTNAVTIAERTVLDEAEELGVNVTMTWHTKLDERVCPVCGPLHGRGPEKWFEDFRQGPPAHVRCRCFLLYHFR